jgi:hypothetical protein
MTSKKTEDEVKIVGEPTKKGGFTSYHVEKLSDREGTPWEDGPGPADSPATDSPTEAGNRASTPAVVGASVLAEAFGLVHGERQEQYGHPADCYRPVGRIWGAILGIPDIPPATVVLMLSGMKVGREATRPSRENRVDSPGYMETKQMIHERDGE